MPLFVIVWQNLSVGQFANIPQLHNHCGVRPAEEGSYEQAAARRKQKKEKEGKGEGEVDGTDKQKSR